MKKLAALMVVLGLVSAVQATITMTVTPIAGTAGTITKFSTVYQGYVVHLNTDGGGVASIDCTFTANGSIFLQRTLFTYDPNMNDGEGGYTLPAIPTAGYSTYKETHFLVPDSARLDVTIAEDSNAVPNPALDNAYGTGTYLRGIFGLKTLAAGGVDQSNGLDFAVLWLPLNSANASVTFTGVGATYANSTATAIDGPTSGPIVFIPEPVTVGLLVAGGLVVLRRRR